MKALIRAFVVLVLNVIVTGGAIAYPIARRGLSTRTEPSRAEEYVARTMRRLATSADVRSMTNPVEPTEAVLSQGEKRKEARRFLAGEDVKSSPPAPHKHDGSQE
ncbi:MAG: hypothetical protein ABR606_03995 [Vicinamibacterales bacterium]